MKEKVFISLICLVLLVFSFFYLNHSLSLPSYQEEEITADVHIKETHSVLKNDGKENPRKPKLYSLSACLIDAANGRPLFSVNDSEIRAMASTTKIMTCLLALERCSQDEIVTVSEYAAKMPDVQMNMTAGEQFRLGDLLLSLMLESHNDTAVAVAEHVGGSVENFCKLMTERSRELGCSNTTFLTPNGLDKEETGPDGNRVHSTTAYELAVIMAECIKNKEFQQICQTPSAMISNLKGTKLYHLTNHNALLQNMEGVLAGKTGFTNNAGYCYVGAVHRDGNTYVAALLGCGWPNNKNYKWYDMNVLVDYAVDNYQLQNYRNMDDTKPQIDKIKVINGFKNGVPIQETAFTVQKDTTYPNEIVMNSNEIVRVVTEWQDTIIAPVEKGMQFGSIQYYIGTKLIGYDRLIVPQAIGKVSFQDYLQLCFSHFIY